MNLIIIIWEIIQMEHIIIIIIGEDIGKIIGKNITEDNGKSIGKDIKENIGDKIIIKLIGFIKETIKIIWEDNLIITIFLIKLIEIYHNSLDSIIISKYN